MKSFQQQHSSRAPTCQPRSQSHPDKIKKNRRAQSRERAGPIKYIHMHAKKTEKETIKVRRERTIHEPHIPLEHLFLREPGWNINFMARVDRQVPHVAQVAWNKAAQRAISVSRAPQ